jgi:hypothetical protein
MSCSQLRRTAVLAAIVLVAGWPSFVAAQHGAAAPPGSQKPAPEAKQKPPAPASAPAAKAEHAGETAKKIPAATKQPPADSKAEAEKPEAAKPEGVRPSGPAPSLQEVVKRINNVMADHNQKVAEQQKAPETQRGRSRATPAQRSVRRAAAVSLKWDPALLAGYVALSWDTQLDPRAVTTRDLGIRLVWPPQVP